MVSIILSLNQVIDNKTRCDSVSAAEVRVDAKQSAVDITRCRLSVTHSCSSDWLNDSDKLRIRYRTYNQTRRLNRNNESISEHITVGHRQSHRMLTSNPVGVRTCEVPLCLSVSLSVRSHISKTKFSAYVLPVAVACIGSLLSEMQYYVVLFQFCR